MSVAPYNRYNRNMTRHLPAAIPLSLLLSLVASLLAAQPRVDAVPVTGATAGSGGSAAAGASLTNSAAQTGNATILAPTTLSGVPGASAHPAPQVLPAPEVQAVQPAAVVAPPRESSAVSVPSKAKVQPQATEAATAAVPVSPAENVAPAAGSELTGAARGLDSARGIEAMGGDGSSVHSALGRVFDAAANSTRVKGGVSGRAQGVREAVAQKVAIANGASPADAPGLYQDAITTARNALPAALADGVARVVRGFAARKAEVSLGDLAASAYEAAAGGSLRETNRLLGGLDKWEALLGAPGRPLVSNAEALKSDVRSFLDGKTAASGRSVPHVWFERAGASLVARIPGAAPAPAAGVSKVPGLAAGFAIAPASFGPEAALADAYRAFSADPRASSGAGLVYRARRSLGSSVPAAAVSASRFWLRAAFESVWRRLVGLLTGSSPYELSRASGRAAAQRDARHGLAAMDEASSAASLLAASTLRVSTVRAALEALDRSARAFESLAGESDARSAVADLGSSFDRGAREQGLSGADVLPPGLASLVSSPGGIAHWAGLLRAQAARAMDARFWRARGGADFLNLGAERSAAVSLVSTAKRLSGPSLAFVALDDRFWARGDGPFGEARLSVDARATQAGGGIRLLVEKGDAALARSLEALGLSVYPTRGGMAAVLGPEDIPRSAEEVGQISVQAAVAVAGLKAPAPPAAAALRELLDAMRRDPSAASALAARLDGRAVFDVAAVIGTVGEYEAVGPVATELDARSAIVAALRDPDTGRLVYARVLRGTAPRR